MCVSAMRPASGPAAARRRDIFASQNHFSGDAAPGAGWSYSKMTIWSARDLGDEGLLKIGELVMKNISKLQPTKTSVFPSMF